MKHCWSSEPKRAGDPVRPSGVPAALAALLIRSVAVLWLISVVDGVVGASSTRQGRGAASPEKYVVLDYAAPPATLKEMYAKSSIVVHAKVKSSEEPRTVSDGHLVLRNHLVEILEVLKTKPDVSLGPGIIVRQFGGTVVINGQKVSTAFPEIVLQAAEAFVLFLAPSPEPNIYDIVPGAGGAFAIDRTGQSVRVPQSVQHFMAAFTGKEIVPLSELLASLRALRDARDAGSLRFRNPTELHALTSSR